MANAPATTVFIHTCLRTKSNVHSVKGAIRSESNLVAVTRMIKVLADVERGAVKAKAKAGKGPGASLRAPGVAMPQRLRPSFMN